MKMFDLLLDSYGPGVPIFSDELVIPNTPEITIRKQLSRLVEEGLVERYSQGVYYIPKETVLGKNKLSIDDILIKIHY